MSCWHGFRRKFTKGVPSSTTHFNLKDLKDSRKSLAEYHCSARVWKPSLISTGESFNSVCNSTAVTHCTHLVRKATHMNSNKLKGNGISTALAHTEIHLSWQYRGIFFLLCALWIHECLKSSNLNTTELIRLIALGSKKKNVGKELISLFSARNCCTHFVQKKGDVTKKTWRKASRINKKRKKVLRSYKRLVI